MGQRPSRPAPEQRDEESPVAISETTPLNPDSRDDDDTSSVSRPVSPSGAAISRKPRRPNTFKALLSTILTIGFFTILLSYVVRDRINKSKHPDHLKDHLTTARNGAVSSDVDVCSQIGVDILQNLNGTAVDSIIATALCIGTVNMYASGIGGGGFMVIRHPNGTSHSINFREMAPGAAHRDMFNSDPLKAQTGGLAVGIPGEVAGFAAAWEMYGRVEWRELFMPSVKLCEDGFNVTHYLKKVMEGEKDFWVKQNKKEWGFLFKDGGKSDALLDEGELMFRPNYGKTLREIAEKGPKAFYKGKIAESIASFVQEKGGVLTVEDMGKYHVQVDETLKVWAFGQEILTCPPPCR